MKQIMVIPAILFVALFLFSCEKKQESGPSSTVTVEITEPADLSAANHGYALRVNTSFYTIDGDSGTSEDKTKWAEPPMALGERVSVGEIRQLTFGGDSKVYDFIEVRRDNGAEGVAWASHIAIGGELAVVTDEKANLFRSPKSVDVTGLILPAKIVAVYFPETESDGFVEVRAYDPQAESNRRHFMRLNSLSRKTSDIQSSILLQTALPLASTGASRIRREALLETALTDYPDSVFHTEIYNLVYPNTAAVIETEPVNLPPMKVNDNNVNVRDIPDLIGNVIGQVSEGDELTIDLQTKGVFTIEGNSSRWYHITDPLEGWVFGAYFE